MPRIRSIKPEFPQSESIGRLSRDARLLFILLWTHVDDEGRARAASRMLASLLYPYDNDVPTLIDTWLDELEDEQCIRRYEHEGSHYLEVVNWRKHQKIDKPSASRLPSFDEGSPVPREASRSLAPDLVSRTLDLGPRTKTLSAAPTVGGQKDFSPREENSQAPPQTNGHAKEYPEDFEEVWREYRVVGSPNSSKADGFKRWKKLSGVDRGDCWTGIVRYAVWLGEERRKRADYPAKHLATFISERGWEPFLEEPA